VFRRKGSDGKKEKETVKSTAPDRDSNSSAGSGGIMSSVKQVIMSGKSSEAPERDSKKAVKDGSAHPHAGSDARYYHTVTASNAPHLQSRSPMLKVMDLFRHRSNSAVSEADKRKAVSKKPFEKSR
jgi:hypothetical protein